VIISASGIVDKESGRERDVGERVIADDALCVDDSKRCSIETGIGNRMNNNAPTYYTRVTSKRE